MVYRPLHVLAATALILAALSSLVDSATAAAPGNTAFERTWTRTDRPVIEQRVDRTWMWGPAPFTGPMMEATTDRPGVGREVQYFDKSRMERTLDPTVSEWSAWYVTNGLLAMELVSGRLQLGDNDFETRMPAEVNVAGDWDDPTGPTYATFSGLLGADALAEGSPVTWRLDRNGTVTDDPSLAAHGVTATYFLPETGHTVAAPFWDFMNATGLVQETGPPRTGQLFPNPFYATGFPVTEAYWANVKVAGEYTDVLVQVFERRVLTYTPGNPAGWQVEAGNVGRHYFEWRYGVSPPEPAGGPERGVAPLGPTPPGQPRDGGETVLTVANSGETPLTIRLTGPESREITLDGCPDCQTGQPPGTCAASSSGQTISLPPGSYTVTVSRPGNIQPLGGIWTLMPGMAYGACFFTIR